MIFRKYLKEKCKACSNKQLPFKYFSNKCSISKLFSKLSEVQKTIVKQISMHKWVNMRIYTHATLYIMHPKSFSSNINTNRGKMSITCYAEQQRQGLIRNASSVSFGHAEHCFLTVWTPKSLCQNLLKMPH